MLGFVFKKSIILGMKIFKASGVLAENKNKRGLRVFISVIVARVGWIYSSTNMLALVPTAPINQGSTRIL